LPSPGGSGLETNQMTPYRLSGGRMLAVACVLVGAGLSQAAAQFPPPPGQTAPAQAAAGSPFPPPPGQGQAPAQDSAFPPPPGQGSRPTAITVGPSGGGGFGPPGGGSFAPPGGGGGFSSPAPQPSEAQKVCLTFPALREDVEKGAAVIKAASARKASREEVCPIFKSFAIKEAKMVAFLETNMKLCGVPPQVIPNVKKNHAQTIRIRDTVCSAAPAAGPAAPTLSDALGGPIIADDQSAKLPGRGTFDTLTGNALQR
jgi:hypothetical protein